MSEWKPCSRRQFLKGTLVGLSAAATPILLASCGGPAAAPAAEPAAATSAPATAAAEPAAEATTAAVEPTTAPAAATSDIVLVSGGWPLNEMPDAEALQTDPAQKGYADALQSWMDQNPGVTIKNVEVDIWDQQAIVAALAGGTAPIWVFASSIGGWTMAGARAAFVQGLMADTTPMIEKYGLKAKLTDVAKAGWEPFANVDGKYYNYPIDAGVNGTIFYRRDLVKELGLKEPAADWTWSDFIELAKGLTSEQDNRKGVALQGTFVGTMLEDHGFELLTQIPTPDTSWNWSRDFSDPRWAELVTAYRKMIFEDQAVLSDVSFENDDPIAKAFNDGTAGMWSGNVLGMFGAATNENSPAALAKRLGKEYPEVVGIASRPRGANGYFVGGSYVGGVSYNPDVTPEMLDKGVGVVDYMFLGPGWDMQKAGQWEATKDLKAVFNYPLPIDGKYTYEGVPGSFADAWGQQTLDSCQYIAQIGLAPEQGLYFPAEQNPGPDSSALDDAWSTLTFEQSADPAAALKTAEETWNTQANGFSSSVEDAAFVDAAKQYYADVDAYWKEKSPEFYESTFQPWYESKVKPNLG